MTLHQKVSHVIGQWQGLDATDRTNQRDRMVSELIALVARESLAITVATASSPRATAAPVTSASAA